MNTFSLGVLLVVALVGLGLSFGSLIREERPPNAGAKLGLLALFGCGTVAITAHLAYRWVLEHSLYTAPLITIAVAVGITAVRTCWRDLFGNDQAPFDNLIDRLITTAIFAVICLTIGAVTGAMCNTFAPLSV